MVFFTWNPLNIEYVLRHTFMFYLRHLTGVLICIDPKNGGRKLFQNIFK